MRRLVCSQVYIGKGGGNLINEGTAHQCAGETTIYFEHTVHCIEHCHNKSLVSSSACGDRQIKSCVGCVLQYTSARKNMCMGAVFVCLRTTW